MASFDAIAAVSRTLRRLLIDRMATAPVEVTLAPPDVELTNINTGRVNLYLYQVLEEAHLRNQSIPGHAHPAGFVLPPLSLTLRFMLTSYARSDDQPDSDLIAQALLGDAMLTLHEWGGRIDNLRLLTSRVGQVDDPLLDPTLRHEFERAKLMLAPVPAEEIAKLWSAMPQANLRRSVVYDVGVVQLEPRMPHHQGQPVATRRILIGTGAAPLIEAAYRTPAAGSSARDGRVAVGDAVTIEHAPLAGDRLYVRFGNLEPIRVVLPSTGVIQLAVPDASYPIDPDHTATRPIPVALRLQPGPLEISLIVVRAAEGVEGSLDRGRPATGERQVRSNILVLQLVPVVTGATASASAANATAVLRVTGARLWDNAGPAFVFVGDAAVPVIHPGTGGFWNAPTDTAVEVPVAAIATVLTPRAQPYAVAAQLNGARSSTSANFRLDP